MGGSSSKSKTDIFMETVNSSFVQSIQSCSMNSDVEQIISIKGDGNVLSNVEMNQVYTSLLTCMQDVNMVAKMQTDMENAIKSAAESQSVALLGVLGSSSSDVDTKIHNSVKNAVNVSTLTQLVNNIKAAQTIYVQGSGNTLLNINMKQVNSNIASSSQQVVANIDVLNTLKNTITQSSTAKQQDPIANLLNGLANLVSGPIMWFAVILIGGLVVLVIFLNTGAGASVLGMAQDQMNGQDDQYSEPEPQLFEQQPQPQIPEPEPQPTIYEAPEPAPSLNSLMTTPENLPKLDDESVNQNPSINEPVNQQVNDQSPPINETINQTYQPLKLEDVSEINQIPESINQNPESINQNPEREELITTEA